MINDRDQMLRIAYDYQIFGLQQYGGISRYFYELSRRVNSTNAFRATIIAPVHINKYVKDGDANVLGLYVPPIRRTGRVIQRTNQLLSSPFMRAYKPDLIHETYYQAVPRRVARCPVVVTVYDMIHEKFPDSFDARDNASIAKRAAVQRASKVICISENTRQDLIDIFQVDPAKTQTIHLGFSFVSSKLRKTSFTSPAKPYFLYVGQRGGYKNFSSMVLAFAASARLRKEFDLVAFGGGPFSEEETQMLASIGIDESTIRQIPGTDDSLSVLYQGATAFVYPSLYEGFGIPPLEAMSMRCPVLCSNNSSIPEVVGDAGLYFDPTSVDEIMHAMENVACSPALRCDLITKGALRLHSFSYDRCASETMAVYSDLIGYPSPAGLGKAPDACMYNKNNHEA